MDPNTATPTQDAQAITPGSPQWDALMVQVGDNAVPGQTTQQPTQEQPQRPDWLPQKFQSPQDLAKAYAELEKKLSTPKASQTPQQNAPGQQSPQGNANEQQAREAAAEVGVNYDALSTEFDQNGELSDESYAKLEKAGIPRSAVDAYISGQQAIADQLTNRVFTAAGGEENYRTMLEWAKTNFSPEEIAAYDRAIYADPASAELAVRGLQAKFQSQNGRFGTIIDGKSGTSNVAGFQSTAELVRAMSDPRYKAGDKAYHAEIEKRLGVTTAF